jgi:hypothetical protein
MKKPPAKKKVTLTATITVWDWQAKEAEEAAKVLKCGSFKDFLEWALSNGIAELSDSAARSVAAQAAAVDSDDPDDKIPF